jgi:hypothetical protein
MCIICSLPGADRLAKKTGAIIIANGEAIRVMRESGVSDNQLVAIAGGERIPLFTAAQRAEAIAKGTSQSPGPPRQDPADAKIWVHAWPSLHALMPSGDHRTFPETIDTATVYTGSAADACTLDVTRGLTYGLGGIIKMKNLPPHVPADMSPFLEYMRDRDLNKYSYFDGGQIMFNFLIGKKVLLWSAHLGGYEGILKTLEPKPDVSILAIAGRANHNGRPFDGSAAQYAKMMVEWLGEPKKIIWCLHDEGPLNPRFTDTRAATETIENETKSTVWDLKQAKSYRVFA